MSELSPAKGSYILVGRMEVQTRIHIGALGDYIFPEGIYLYCGSACGPGGLRSRIAHHLRSNTQLHWHIDFLKPWLEVNEVWFLEDGDPYECRFLTALLTIPGASHPVRQFGSSDCRSACFSHLIHFQKTTKLSGIFYTMQNDFIGISRFVV